MRLFTAIALLSAALLALPAGVAHGGYRGKLEIRHTDDFAHGHSHTSYKLVRGGRRIPLVLARAPHSPSGSVVVVNGRRIGSRIRGTVSPLGGFVHAATVQAGPRNTAVILINFATDTTTPFTPDEARAAVFTSSGSVNAFYTDESYGDVSLKGSLRTDGDVFGWYTLNTPTDTCDVDTWAAKAKAAAVADGFVAGNYKHVVYMFPKQASCGNWAGLGEMPGSQAWINGTLSVRVIAHELGHNMGLHHASSLTCTSGGSPVAYSPSCTPDEYGDPFDVMGNKLRHNNAWHLRQIGFMPAANVKTAAANGTYTLSSAISKGNGTQLLRVPRTGSSPKRYFDLELRTSGGVFDNYFSTDPAVQGVTIHLDPEVTTLTQSLLIDTTPGSSGGFTDAPLTPGRTFTDGVVSITVQSVSGTTATVDVATALPPDTQPPSAPAPVAEAAADHVTLRWPASTDNVGVTGYRVYRGADLAATLSGTEWIDTAVTPGTTYSYKVVAYDAAGNAASSGYVSATVPASQTSPPPGNTSPPSGSPPPGSTRPPPDPGAAGNPPGIPVDSRSPVVRITSPARGSRVRTRTVIRAQGSDDVGVLRIELWLDGKLRAVVADGRLAWRWQVAHSRPGRHLIVVRAYDASGNRGASSRRVFVVR